MGLFGSSDDSSQAYMRQALDAYNQALVPTIEEEQVNAIPLETVQGTVNPDAIQVAQQAPSAYNNIALDPATRAAQISALSQYTDIASAGGLDANAKLAIQQAIDATNAQSQGAQGAIQRQAQAMGQGGGDFALTQRALAAQGASNTGATQGLQAAAMAEANREAALNQMANIGGGINAADYGQAANKAAAQNQINATNQAATNNANIGNVANKIQTGEFNTGMAQNVNAANTGARQNQTYYNASLPQQKFNNELSKANGIAGVSSNQANAAMEAAKNSSAMLGAGLGAVGGIIGGIYGGPGGAAVGQKAGQTAGQSMAHGGYACYADGGIAHDHAICMKLGGHISGKAEVAGDSEKNDTVPALLSPGELVIPRSVPKDGASMEEFAKHAPIGGDTHKKVDATEFTKNYRRGK